jgi:phosphoribosylanthranilate isomerase
MTEIKICGLTRREDVELACALGAAYVGFNFASVSPRRVSLETARDLSRATRPGVARVGVFVHETREEILEAIEAAGLDLVQIHRPLAPDDLDDMPRPVIAVERVSSRGIEVAPPALLARCRSVLLDTAGGRPGGTGTAFDWNILVGKTWPVPLILAGGLGPENVAEAISRVRPAAVDVASGVESSPGIKDVTRLRLFFKAVEDAESLTPSSSGTVAG